MVEKSTRENKEIETRFNAALGRALTTPHKPQAATKVAKPKTKKKKPSR